MLQTSSFVPRLGAVIASCLMAASVLAGCGGGEDEAPDASGASSSPSDPAGDQTSGDGADGEPQDGERGSVDAATDPDSPFVVAASAVGTRSRNQVITLHAMGTSTGPDSRVPREAIPGTGTKIQGELETLVQDATRMTPPEGSAAERLTAALSDYRDLARQLSRWEVSEEPMSTEWFTRLAAAQEEWTSAMKELSGLSDRNLLEDMPELLMPKQ